MSEEKVVPVPTKSESELLQERLERYKKDPNSFIEVDDIVACVIKNPKSSIGVSVMTGNTSRSQMDIGQVELNHQMDKMRMQMDIQSEMHKQNKIVKPGSMHNFARKIMRK